MLAPYGNRILVTRIAEPRLTSSLLVLPETISERPSPFAGVLAVGAHITEDVTPGDMVVLSDYSGAPVTTEVEGQQVEAFIVPMSEVLMVIER